MADNSSSNITQLLTSFESFIKIIEDREWPQTAKIEDIKTAFKLGNYIEKTSEHFRIENSLSQFLILLTKWLKTKDRSKVYNDLVYIEACDELLFRFFISPDISENSLDIAVRVYTSMFPKQRFEAVMTKLLLNAGNLEALSDYVKTNFSDDEAQSLGYHLKLKYWETLLQKGEIKFVKEEVQDMLTPYNIETFFYLLIGVLSLRDISEEEKAVEIMVLNSVLEKMLERNILTKQLWITMFKSIDINRICNVCLNYPDFLIALLNFIVYIGSMMKKVGNFWKSDPSICFCPEIDYDDITFYICKLCKINSDTKELVIARLKEAEKNTGSNIWNQILTDLKN